MRPASTWAHRFRSKPPSSAPNVPDGDPGERRTAALPMLAGLGFLTGAWALIPPYTGPPLNTAARVEFVDHVVPGIVVIAISALAFLFAGRAAAATALFPAGLAIFLAGFWMSATHAPLVLQAIRQEAPWGATIYHSVPGIAVLGLGVVWAFTYRTRPPDGD